MTQQRYIVACPFTQKNFEELVIKYPHDFLSYSSLKLIDANFKIGNDTYIVFENYSGTHVIVKVKLGVLLEGDIDTMVKEVNEYYKKQKNIGQSLDIKMVVVANTISDAILENYSDRYKGMLIIETPLSKVIEIARESIYKHGENYNNADTRDRCLNIVSEIDTKVLGGQSRVWIFQTKPHRYDFLNAFNCEKELTTEAAWLVTKYTHEIKKGDFALIWMSKSSAKANDAGIYAVAEVTSDPKSMESNSKFWIDSQDPHKSGHNLRVELSYKLIFLSCPIYRNYLKTIPSLKYLSILRQAAGTNFKVSSQEWNEVSNLIKNKCKNI